MTGTYLGSKTFSGLTKLHGWLMWIAWGVLGMIQLGSNRYLKAYWSLHMWIHRIAGTIMLLLTLSMGLVGISRMNWTLSGSSAHYVIGLIVFFSIFFVAVGGVAARSVTRRLKWKTKFIHRFQGIHKVS